MRRYPPLVLGALTLLPGVLRESCARADEGVVAIDCPSFDGETRAALDARARAELLVRSRAGTLIIVCQGSDATLTWHPLDGSPTARTMPLADDARASIDRFLEALDLLLTSKSQDGEAEGTG